MNAQETGISGVYVVGARVLEDQRGLFYRAFCDSALERILGGKPIRQTNVSVTRAVGAVRGLHFQYPPSAEIKLVRCLKGRVWDLAVDLRKGSDTFLQYHAATLSPGEANMLVIPEGCAHGFQVLEEDSTLLYLHTAAYDPGSEGGVRFDDPRVGVDWPLEVRQVSERDRNHPLLTHSFEGIEI